LPSVDPPPPFLLSRYVSSSVVSVSVDSVVSSSPHPGGARAPPGGRDRQRPAGPGPAQTPRLHDDDTCPPRQHVDTSPLPVPVGQLPVLLSPLPVPIGALPIPVSPLPVQLSQLPVPLSPLPVLLSPLPVLVSPLPVPLCPLPVLLSPLPVSPDAVSRVRSEQEANRKRTGSEQFVMC